jgi:hypothetical protein
MSLDAMDWVWNRSASRGAARSVLLAIADKAGEDCTAYAGTTMLVQRANAARSTVVAAVDRLLASGELVVVEGAKGPRGETVYRLPHAVGHVRAETESPAYAGPVSAPVRDSDPSENQTPSGPETGPHRYGNRTGAGPETGPQNASERNHQAEQQPRAVDRRSSVLPELRPLADALGAAGVDVRWSLGLGEQRDVWQLAQQHGVEALVDLAARRTACGDGPKPARYWLKVWSDLDRAPATRPASAGGPRRPAPQSPADTLAAGLALLQQQKGTAQ